MATAYQVKQNATLKFNNIAVLTDFSSNADTALRYAAALARVYGAKLRLAHAYLPPTSAYAAPEAALAIKTFEDRREDLENRLLAQTEAAFLKGIKCATMLRIGAPVDLPEDLHDADLIVVGTSGASGVEKAVLGSTAERIFRSSHIPVLTVGPHARSIDSGKMSLSDVLYVTDFSTGATMAFSYALSIASENSAKLVLLHVVEDKDVAFSFHRAMASAEPLERLKKLIPSDAGLKQKPECIVSFGAADKVILEEAASRQSQIIVMGARGAGAVAGVVCRFGGGTAYKVAAHASCPVLTIRE